MKQRPILFSAAMVRGLRNGTKTQTRRIASKTVRHPDLGNVYSPGALVLEREPQHVIERSSPHGQPGDLLWVREAWKAHTTFDHLPPRDIPQSHVWYLADDGYKPESRTRASMHMPRWASRITLEITAVRIERLQDISEADAIAEGIDADQQPGDKAPLWRNYATGNTTICPQHSYRTLWESINGAGSWDVNHWVWVMEFKRLTT